MQLNNINRLKKNHIMKLKIFKPAFTICLTFLVAGNMSFAQDVMAKPIAPADSVAAPVISTDVNVAPTVDVVAPVTTTVNVNENDDVQQVITVKSNNVRLKAKLHRLKAEIKNVSVSANVQLKVARKNLSAELKEVAPQINMAFKESDDETYNENIQDDNSLTKNFTKTYPVDGNDQVVLDNRYGNIVVNTWARNEVKVDVQIRVSADNNEAAQKMLDNVSISDSKDGNTVAFKTNINTVKNSWMSLFKGNGGNHQLQIDYIVYMPSKNELVVSNRYGGIVLPNLDGKVTISSAYGNLAAKTLSNESVIQLKYGNADIENVGKCAIELSYGNLRLGSANNLSANLSYSSVKVGKLRETGSINVRYGDGVQIGDLDRNLRSLSINASYSGVDLGLSGDENADFAVTVHYGDFNYGDHNVTITGKNPGDNDKGVHMTRSYKGYIGKSGNSGKTIAINDSYGSVKFD